MAFFIPRSALRDQEQDLQRIRLVADTISSVCGELQREIDGLTLRHSASREKATEVLLALESEGNSGKLERKLDEVESALIYCERRTAQLGALRAQFSVLLDSAALIRR
ncbi:hypothetical protein [Mesorhizobium sp. CAU 1741]|uniref:hypothetical protein n=1 Tax=Mesorhizobium sp. CAU 1741 TaxID=3140366 RepID=UPI00325B54FD